MVFPSEYFHIMIWINIQVCFPLTFLVILLCLMVRLDHIPVTYYINLLISNLIQIIILIIFTDRMGWDNYSYYSDSPHDCLRYCYSGVGSICFRMIFAVERFLFLTRPQFRFMRKTRGFVTVCILVWMLFIVLFSLFIASQIYYAQIIFVLFTTIMFIICLAVTLRSLCTATSDPAQDKCRVVGTLVILLVNNIVIILPMLVYVFNPGLIDSAVKICFTLSLHCPLLDFLLLVFMSKWLLMCLCCCRKRNPAVNNSRSDVQQDRQLSSETDMKRENEGDQV